MDKGGVVIQIPDIINKVVDEYDLYGCEVSEIQYRDADFFMPVRGKSDRWLNWNIRRLLKLGYLDLLFRYWNDTEQRMSTITIRIQPDMSFTML